MSDHFVPERFAEHMDNLMQSLRKVALLVLGACFFVTGWQASAQAAKDRGAKDKEKKAASTGKKKDTPKKQKKTTLEKKWPENASGSE